jgi:tricorn protease
MTARGRAALASTDKSRLVEVNLPGESRIRKATLGPEGEWVYGFGDSGGELELWRYAADGSPRAEQLTRDGSNFRWNFALSPDGRWIAHDDNNGDLWLLDTKSGSNRKIVGNAEGLGPYESLVWSGDSKLLAISHVPQDQRRARLSLYSVDRKSHQLLTSDRYVSNSPSFSADGQWLYFLSEREFKPFPSSPWGDRVMGVAFDRRSQIFAYGLTSDARFPFADPTELSRPEDDEASNDDGEDDEGESSVQIDWEGIKGRLWQVPVPAGNYAGLAANEERLYFLSLERGPDAVPSLLSIPIEPEPKPEVFSEKVEEFGLSADGKKLFLRQKDDKNAKLFIVDAGEKFPEDSTGTQVQAGNWRLRLEPRQEWRQMFHDAWLMHRDSFFDANMRGLDWVALETKYRPLLDRLADRRDLDDLLGQMMGELGALHSSVRGGDYRKDADAPGFAGLGARFSQEGRGVVIDHIFRHDPELPDTAPPVARPGVDARAGDRLIAINGKPVSSPAEIGEALKTQAGKQVLLELQRGRKRHKAVVVAADWRTSRKQQYRDWVVGKRQRVQAANPDIGYLHLYSMTGSDLGSFARDFYANNHKPGLIIDVRRNGGGNVDSVLLEKLMRRAWSFWQNRNPTIPSTNMQDAFRGHLVVLADQFTYSDGETFTAGVQALGLAPVIGKQTAGAGVWLRGLNRLSDKGMARVAEFPVYAMDGRWINEGTGVAPTIEVDNLPHATFNGEDAQLNAAIHYLERKLREEPVPPLKAKPFPPGTTPAHELQDR